MFRIDEKLNKTVMESTIDKESPDAGTLADLNVDKSDFTDKAWKETYEVAKSGAETVEVYLDDLKEETKQYIINELFDGEIENFDVKPLLILDSDDILAMEDDSIGIRTNEGINFFEDYSENTEIPQWFVDAVEELDWSCKDSGSDVELENWSPAGEDLIIYAEKSDLVGSLFDNYQYFDKGEHIKTLLDAKANGFAGVPDIDTLVEDADDILLMYKELADKVAEAAKNAENGETNITEEYDGPMIEDDLDSLKRYIDVEIPGLCNDLVEIIFAHDYKQNTIKRMLEETRTAYNRLSDAYQDALEGQL